MAGQKIFEAIEMATDLEVSLAFLATATTDAGAVATKGMRQLHDGY